MSPTEIDRRRNCGLTRIQLHCLARRVRQGLCYDTKSIAVIRERLLQECLNHGPVFVINAVRRWTR